MNTTQHSKKMKMKNSTGFTLIELMITVAIMSILLTVGLPSFQSIITDGRLTSTANAMLSAYQLARTEAIKQRKNVYVATTDNWATWEVKVENAAKPFSTFEASKNIVIDASSIDFGGYSANGRAIDSTGHSFSTGSCEENSPCGITFKSSNASDTNQRTLKVVMTGRIKITTP